MERPNILWLESLSSRGIRPGLDNIRGLLAALGDPQKGLRTVHVAGSDGKGSVCCMLESILRSAGYRTGMFTSPHILKVNESVRIDGEDISDVLLDGYLSKVREASSDSGIECTNFEALTACAILAFRTENVDIAIIEVGMGGRLDATNVVEPEVTVINGISLEHTRYLGPDIASIASEKAGIMKAGVPCVTANTGEALKVIEDRAEELSCPLTVVDRDDVTVTELASDHTAVRYGCSTYRIGIPGSYQGCNAAVAVEAVRLLRDADRIIQFIPIGLDSAYWPVRMEKIDGFPLIVDGTHTRKGAEYLAKDIPLIYGKVVLVTAMLEDKDLEGVAEILSGIATEVLVSAPDSPRAADPEALASHYRKHHSKVTVCGSIGEAVEQALKKDGYILVTGSFRTAEECLRWLKARR